VLGENRGMNDQEFDKLLANVVADLKDKQDRLAADYGIGRSAKWWFDLETETLQFLDGEGNAGTIATIVNIGSFAPTSGSWKWAWGNSSVPPTVRRKSERLRELQQITGFDLFGRSEPFRMDEAMAWEMTAFAVWHLRALGCYRAPSSGGLQIFLAIMSIDRARH
jgi:hypothetical protein